MNLKVLFLILALIVACPFAVLIWLSSSMSVTVFFVIEGLALLSLIYLIFFYRKVVSGFDTLSNGMSMLHSQDWNSTLCHAGQQDIDSVVDTFNAMFGKLKEQRIRYEEQSHLLHRLIECTSSGVLILDSGSCVMLKNAALVKLLGCDISVGDDLSRCDNAVLKKFISLAPGHECTVRQAGHGVALQWVCHSFINAGVTFRFFMVENITAAVVDAERAGYEKVIRVISHEVNNTMGGLISALDTIDGMNPAESFCSEDVKPLLSACSSRARSLSKFISSYAEVVKIPQPELKYTSLNAFLNRSMPFLQSVVSGKDVNVEFDITDNLPRVMMDAAQIEQVLVNIIKNSAESITSSGRAGVVKVTAATVDGHAEITVTDNGPGLSELSSVNLFTPFFTDKPGGQGIGLLTARDILRAHSCEYSLRTSDIDGLTRFIIKFPDYE